MTKKELFYYEDAIEHETNIISILEESVKNTQDEKITSFLNSEIELHNKTKEQLLNKMEEKVNE